MTPNEFSLRMIKVVHDHDILCRWSHCHAFHKQLTKKTLLFGCELQHFLHLESCILHREPRKCVTYGVMRMVMKKDNMAYRKKIYKGVAWEENYMQL